MENIVRSNYFLGEANNKKTTGWTIKKIPGDNQIRNLLDPVPASIAIL